MHSEYLLDLSLANAVGKIIFNGIKQTKTKYIFSIMLLFLNNFYSLPLDCSGRLRCGIEGYSIDAFDLVDNSG